MPNHVHFLIRVKTGKELNDHRARLKEGKRQQAKVLDSQGDLKVHEFVMFQFKLNREEVQSWYGGKIFFLRTHSILKEGDVLGGF